MKTITKTMIVFLLQSVLFFSCVNHPPVDTPTDLAQTAFIPLPVSVTPTGEVFTVRKPFIITYNENIPELGAIAGYLAGELNNATGLAFETAPVANTPRKGIYLTLSDTTDNGAEGYELNIGKKLVTITGATPSGCFYGLQTLLQTIPVKTVAGEPVYIATGIIRDYPEYEYRGAMLDVSRHFFPPEDVKRLIDLLAVYKINYLHMHLSDDQGWRIEIKSWPELTAVGGSTEVDGGEGGFYTQEDYAGIVKYAMERQITIVPEIDMPGHTNAALASYAELNCDGKAKELYTGTKVGFSSLCINKDFTYQVIDSVIRELAALTPGPYFHIGGDESHATKHDDYIFFVNKVQEIVARYGKKVIGWDEIANATLATDATVQYWARAKNARLGIEKGAMVLMSPASKAYLDMKYDTTTTLGLHWAGYINVQTAYDWDPATIDDGIVRENILGIDVPLWTETVTNISEIEYMFFPRLAGYAEIGWTTPEKRAWEEYKTRLAKHGKRFVDMNINFHRSVLVDWEE